MLESQLKKKIYKELSKFHNIYYRKLSDRFTSGLLDLIIIYKGKHVWLELKIWPNTATQLQENEIERIRAAGGSAYILCYKPPDHYLLKDVPNGIPPYILYHNNLTELLTAVLTEEEAWQKS